MSEQAPRQTSPEERTIVHDPIEVAARLAEEDMTRKWVDVSNSESIEDFNSYLNRNHDSSESSQEEEPIGPEAGIYSDDVFYNADTDSVYSIGRTRTVGDKEVFMVTAEYKGHDGEHKKAVMELDEAKAKEYLLSRGATLLEPSSDRALVAESMYHIPEASTQGEVQADTQGEKSDDTSDSDPNPDNDGEPRPKMVKVFEKTTEITANDVKRLIDTAKDHATSSTETGVNGTNVGDNGERRIMGVTRDAAEIRAMAEVAANRQASNAERIQALRDKLNSATGESQPEQSASDTGSSADRIARLRTKVAATETAQTPVQPQAEQTAATPVTREKRTVRGFFRGLGGRIKGIFGRKNRGGQEIISPEEQLRRDNRANNAAANTAGSSTGELFTPFKENGENKDKLSVRAKARVKKFGASAYDFFTWDARYIPVAPDRSRANVADINKRRDADGQSNNTERKAA